MIFIITVLWTVSWIWMIVIAFKNDQTVWGIVMIVFGPSNLIYGLLNWDKASKPYLMLLLAVGLIFTLSPSELEQASQ